MKPYTIKNREGESISPMTSTKTVFDEKGVDLDTLLSQQRQDADNALKEYAKKSEVTQAISGKQDKLSTTTDLHITDENILGLTELAKMRLFDDMWKSVPITSIDRENHPDEPYGVNGLWLNYKQAISVYEYAVPSASQMASAFANIKIRTNILRCLNFAYSFSLNRSFFYNSTIEVALVGSGPASSQEYAFYGCSKLREIIGIIDVAGAGVVNSMFLGCANLEKVYIERLGMDAYFTSCKIISIDSLQYLITKRIYTNAITITVHPDVYAKLTGDTTNEAAAALTSEELAKWEQLLLDATEKNISFATT